MAGGVKETYCTEAGSLEYSSGVMCIVFVSVGDTAVQHGAAVPLKGEGTTGQGEVRETMMM